MTTLDPGLQHDDDARARRNVLVLIAAQAILGAQMPMIFVVGGLAGQMLAPNPCWATLPISMIVLGSMLSATPMSALMGRYGRRAGFWLGSFGGTLGALIGAYALTQSSFPLFLVGAFFTGWYQSAQGFFRFAAADTASDAFRPKAISYVLAGGLVSAIVGPQLVKLTAEAMLVPFLGSYIAVVVLNLIGIVIFAFVDIPKPESQAEAGHPAGRSTWEMLKTPTIFVSIVIAMVSYALMNLLMTSTPLAVVGCGFETGTAANIVSAHVLAMYAPSFFTGHLIARFGVEKIVALGLVILAGAGAVAGAAAAKGRPLAYCAPRQRQAHRQLSTPRPSTTQTSGTRRKATATKVTATMARHSGMPMMLVLSADISLMPVAVTSPAATAPMPRSAPCTPCRSATAPKATASASTPSVGSTRMPASAAIAPGTPNCRPPNISDRFTTLGPGRICATAQSSTNWALVIQRFFSTSSRCTTASTPPKPCRASQLKDQNRSPSELGVCSEATSGGAMGGAGMPHYGGAGGGTPTGVALV